RSRRGKGRSHGLLQICYLVAEMPVLQRGCQQLLLALLKAFTQGGKEWMAPIKQERMSKEPEITQGDGDHLFPRAEFLVDVAQLMLIHSGSFIGQPASRGEQQREGRPQDTHKFRPYLYSHIALAIFVDQATSNKDRASKARRIAFSERDKGCLQLLHRSIQAGGIAPGLAQGISA